MGLRRDGFGTALFAGAVCTRRTRSPGITDKLLEPRPGSVRAQLEELRTFAVSRLTDLRKLLTRPEAVNEARSLLSEQVGRISLWPVAEEAGWHYEAKGSVDFFGEEAGLRVGGAGGPVSIVSPILPIRAEAAVAA